MFVYNIGDVLIVKQPYVQNTLSKADPLIPQGSRLLNIRRAAEALSGLGLSPVTVADTGQLQTFLPDQGTGTQNSGVGGTVERIFARLIPSDITHSLYNAGWGVAVYWEVSDSTTFNDAFEFAKSYIVKPECGTQVYNSSGSLIQKGTVLKLTGYDAVQELSTVDLAAATSIVNSAIYGIAEADIADNSIGTALVEGSFSGLDTSAFQFNALVYLSDTPGQISPVAGTVSALVGRVQCAAVAPNGVITIVGNIPLLGGIGGGGPGAMGATGVQGSTGLGGGSGDTGIQGLVGGTGIQGTQGDTGIFGLDGQTGVFGLDGETGIQGLVGETGIQGVTGVGPDADTPAVQARRTTQLALVPGFIDVDLDTTDVENNAAVIDHDPGLNSDRINIHQDGDYRIVLNTLLSFSTTTSQGSVRVRVNDTTVVPGTTGDAAGDMGSIAHISREALIALSAGDFITLQADEVVGTVILEPNTKLICQKLVGGAGAQGITGLVGDTGMQGVTGIQPAFQGETGIQGVTGTQGVTGVIGDTGIQGIQGVTGVIGDTGILGETGIIGDTGIQGNQGVTGVIGDTGIQGIQGVTGTVGGTGIQGSTGLGAPVQRDIFTGSVANGQTLFTLSATPSDTTLAGLEINGVVYRSPTFITIVGTALTWLNSFMVVSTDTIDAVYPV